MKVIIFLFGYILCIATAVLSVMGVSDDSPLLRQVGQGTIVELIGCVVIVGLYYGFIRKQSVKTFSVSLPSKKLIAIALLLCPFICFIRVMFAYGKWDELFILNADYTWQEVLETLALIPFVALLAPIVEEFGMRVYSITPFETKTGRIVAAIMTSLLFSFMHISRWKIVFAAGLVYTLILLISKNVWLSVTFHIGNNLATILIPAFSGIYILIVPNAKYGIVDTPIPIVIIMAVMFVVGLYMAVIEMKKMGIKEIIKRFREI